ncbi:hypothetical protein N7517_011158 [Penicillium concentricum]|uniref:Uncharacterized protein n=1 Tax=Penicillium concentricum TaxID=293559 RepID=A0A9W9RC16_9EURO|nr:uncharacterized protein N7517_011158 [Penicillium concentricum]KAJ5356549.1 hypothetical protein N7517_011158 [Penicillium concentricum]
MDAEWWFENSNKNTRLVLLFKIHKNHFWVDVELWSAPDGTRPGPPTHQNIAIGPDHPEQFKPLEKRTPLSITQALRATGDAVTVVKGPGPDISLDYELLMWEDRPPRQAEIVITPRILQVICKEIY